MSDTLKEEYLFNRNSKANLPKWFVPLYKTLLNKNITTEDWNTLMRYVQTLASDTETLFDYAEATFALPMTEDDLREILI